MQKQLRLRNFTEYPKSTLPTVLYKLYICMCVHVCVHMCMLACMPVYVVIRSLDVYTSTIAGNLYWASQLIVSTSLVCTQTLSRYIYIYIHFNIKSAFAEHIHATHFTHIQYTLILPLLVGHVLFHASLSVLEDRLHYHFNDRQLFQVHYRHVALNLGR